MVCPTCGKVSGFVAKAIEEAERAYGLIIAKCPECGVGMTVVFETHTHYKLELPSGDYEHARYLHRK